MPQRRKLDIPWQDLQQLCHDPTDQSKLMAVDHYNRNINIYLEQLRFKNLHCHRFIVAHASIDCAKRATPDKFPPCGWYCYESSWTDGSSQTEDNGKCASEVCMFIIRMGKFLQRSFKWNIFRLHRMFVTSRPLMRVRASLWLTDKSCHVSIRFLTLWARVSNSLPMWSMWVDNAKEVIVENHSACVASAMEKWGTQKGMCKTGDLDHAF